ncbi:MAG: sulfur carrier protein ThiS [Chitinophagales bacterium]|nr:sulfur carrier protein ThiS [Chitinophagales bacterium]MDW8428385.1 sulfur carrier protein ThiS [Chitinophagales bacterium]
MDSVDQALRLTVNGSPTTCGRPCSIAQLIELLKLTGAKGMAVAVNGRVIPAAHWGSHFLNDDDQVLIVHAVQGG